MEGPDARTVVEDVVVEYAGAEDDAVAPQTVQRFVDACVRMAPAMRRTAYDVLHHAHDAEDAVQDACLAGWRSIAALREPRALEGWILRIAHNRAVSRARARVRQGRPELRVHDDALDADPGLPRVAQRRGSAELRPDAAAALRDALRAMPSPQREALLLRYVRGLTLREVARRQGTSLGGVKTRLYRGREHLRRAVST
jgi:RNA polymerase sigma-70 factor (ECF subfamily)